MSLFALQSCGGYDEETVVKKLNEGLKKFECQKSDLDSVSRYVKHLPTVFETTNENFAIFAQNLNQKIFESCPKPVLKILKIETGKIGFQFVSKDDSRAHKYTTFLLTGPVQSIGITLSKESITGGFAGRDEYSSFVLKIVRKDLIAALTLISEKI